MYIRYILIGDVALWVVHLVSPVSEYIFIYIYIYILCKNNTVYTENTDNIDNTNSTDNTHTKELCEYLQFNHM